MDMHLIYILFDTTMTVLKRHTTFNICYLTPNYATHKLVYKCGRKKWCPKHWSSFAIIRKFIDEIFWNIYEREPIATKFNHDKIWSNPLLELRIDQSTNCAVWKRQHFPSTFRHFWEYSIPYAYLRKLSMLW